MPGSDDIKQHQLEQLPDLHARLGELMEARLVDAEPDDVERYFATLSTLVVKLEDDDKTLRDVMAEMVADALPLLMSELAG